MLRHVGELTGTSLCVWRQQGDEWLPVGTSGGNRPTPGAPTLSLPGFPSYRLEVVGPLAGGQQDRLVAVVLDLLRAAEGMRELHAELSARHAEVDLLYSIGEMLGRSESVEQVAARLLDEVTAVIGARQAALRVHDPSRGTLDVVASVGVAAERLPRSLSVDADADAVVVRAFVSGRIEHGPQPEWVAGDVLAVPILYAASGQPHRVTGTLALADRAQGGSFTREETRLLAAVAMQVGAALENARLVVAEREQLRVARELEMAHDLQIKLMPTPAVLRGEAEVAIHSVPAESLGGDFYTFTRLGRERVGVMIGDVSSHGFSAALIAAQVMAAAGIHGSAGNTPDQAMELIRASLAGELESTEMYLTLFYGVLDPTAGRLTYASAGHPYAYRLPRHGAAERLEPTAPPLGLADGVAIARRIVPWNFAGDQLVLFTDGLIDQPREDGERFGEARLLGCLEDSRGLPPERMVDSVRQALAEFGGKGIDDTTLLILRM